MIVQNGLTAYGNTKEYRFIEKNGGGVTSHIPTTKTTKFSELLVEKGADRGMVDLKKLDEKDKELYGHCVEMESFLWKQVLNSMKETINKHKLIDGGQSEQIFTDFLYGEYSMMMAQRSGTDC